MSLLLRSINCKTCHADELAFDKSTEDSVGPSLQPPPDLLYAAIRFFLIAGTESLRYGTQAVKTQRLEEFGVAGLQYSDRNGGFHPIKLC